jgi:hypothetical protein
MAATAGTYADSIAELAPAHAAERLAAFAQLIGFMIAVEGDGEGAARAVLPFIWPQAAPGAHVIDQPAPVLLRPLPRFEVLCRVVHGFLLLFLRSY